MHVIPWSFFQLYQTFNSFNYSMKREFSIDNWQDHKIFISVWVSFNNYINRRCVLLIKDAFSFYRFKNNVKIVHFIGATKPWHQPFNTSSGEVTPLPDSGHNAEFLQLWWTIFMEDVQQTLDPNLVGIVNS